MSLAFPLTLYDPHRAKGSITDKLFRLLNNP